VSILEGSGSTMTTAPPSSSCPLEPPRAARRRKRGAVGAMSGTEAGGVEAEVAMRSPSLPIGPRRRQTRSRRRSSPRRWGVEVAELASVVLPRRMRERWRRRAPPLLLCAGRVRWMSGLSKLSSVVVWMSSGSAVARQQKW
jgi:hypothetical protein